MKTLIILFLVSVAVYMITKAYEFHQRRKQPVKPGPNNDEIWKPEINPPPEKPGDEINPE